MDDELLKYAVKNGMIDLSYVQEQVEMNKRKELLRKHPYKIWEGKDGKWRTYIPDKTKPNSRRLIKRLDVRDIEDEVIEYIKNNLLYEEKSKDLSLRGIFPEWIDYKAKHTNSSSYIKRITADWKKYYVEKPDFISKPISEFTKVELDIWAHDMIKGKEMTKKQYYNMSLILRQELDYAVEMGYIEKNVFNEVKINTKMFRRVKKKDGETQVYMTDEIPKMVCDMMRRFQNDPSDTAPLAVLLDFEIGVRIGELTALRKGDISEDGRYIHIQRQTIREFEKVDDTGFVMRFSGFKVVEYTKSDDGDRTVYLTELARKIIWLVLKVNERYGYECEDYLFVKGNRRISHYAIQSRVYRGCESIGIITKTMHKIRKTYISSLIDSGLNIDEIRRQAGHSDERTTYGNYCFNRLTSEETQGIMENALKYGLLGDMEFVYDEVIKGNQKSAEEMPRICDKMGKNS